MSKLQPSEFYKLDTWKNCHHVVLQIYKITKKFPDNEKFGLTTQMQRAATSITSNIAEGFGRYYYMDKVRFYYFASGSLSELKNQLMISKDLEYISQETFEELFNALIICHKMLISLISANKKQAQKEK